MLMYVYIERINKKQGVKYSIKTCCRKGLQQCDVVSLLFVPPDAKNLSIFQNVWRTFKKYMLAVPFNAEVLFYVLHTMTSKLYPVILV